MPVSCARARRIVGRARVLVLSLLIPSLASAQVAPDPPVEPEPPSPPADPSPPAPDPIPAPVAPDPTPPLEERPARSEGRMLVSAYNSGFQWGISPGVVFVGGEASFFLGLRLGYGVDLDTVIVVPGVRAAGYFTDPNVFVGMPTVKLVLPLDRFAPFIEAGAGLGHVTDPTKSGLALMGGGGFMIHFSRIAFGAEASYQVIRGTGFKGFGIGPILAIGF